MWVMANYPRLERFGTYTPVTVKIVPHERV